MAWQPLASEADRESPWSSNQSRNANMLGSRRGSMDSQSRSIVKTFSWRIIATLTGGGIVFWQTNALNDAFTFMGVEFPLKMLFYYLHERGWGAIGWGV